MGVVRPCLERLPSGVGCPKYAIEGGSRCPEHHREALKNRTAQRGGTTPEWRRARKQALDRDGHRCTRCGKTQDQARAESKHGRGLEVHHLHGTGNVRSAEHDVDLLVTLCRPCHLRTWKRKTRPTLDEYKAQIVARAKARRAEQQP